MTKVKAEPKIRPLADFVLVRREAVEDGATFQQGGKIVMPQTSQDKPQRGVVVAVGPGKFCPEMINADERFTGNVGRCYAPMHVKEGDTVIFSRYGGSEIKDLGDDDLLMMRESDIWGVIER